MGLSIGTISLRLDSALDSGAYAHVVGINAGGPTLTLADGRQFLSDRHFVDGNIASTTEPIANTLDDLLYQTERWGPAVWTIPVTAGTYRVRVLLAEIYGPAFAIGARVFTIKFQPGTSNEITVADVDVFATSGQLAATEIVQDVVVTSSKQLVIQTIAQVQQPAIKAIVVQSNAGGAYDPTADPPPASGSPSASESTVIRSTAFQIPPEFVGLHIYRWPRDNDSSTPNNSTAPTFSYGLFRSMAYIGSNWVSIHRGSNPANWTWSQTDEMVKAHSDRGVPICYTIAYTPAHLASLPDYPSPFPSWPGASSMPTSMSELALFVRTLLQRYNTGGQRKITALEIWNEPMIDGTNYTVAGGATAFWVGSVTGNSASERTKRLDELALLHKTVAVAAKGVDSSIQIVGPGWSPGGNAVVSSYWTAYYNRAISTGGTPLQYTDVFGCHPYSGAGTSGSGATSATMINTVTSAYRTCANAVNPSLPLWGTEAGNEGSSVTLDQHATIIKRKAMLAAGAGMASIHWYAYEDDQYLGNPYQNSVPRAALAELTTRMVGRTMTRCSILSNGKVWAVFSDGTVWEV